MSGGNASGDESQSHKKRKLEQHAMGEQTERTAPQGDGSGGAVEDRPVGQEGIDQRTTTNDKQLIHQLLEPFSREQLLEILTSAATQHEDVFEEVRAIANADVSHRKVFVRGLAWETTSDKLKAAFAVFGEVEEGAVIFDKATSKSRGYGFVTFVEMASASRAVETQAMEIDGRRATCNLASVRAQSDDQQHQHGSQGHAQAHPYHQQSRSMGQPIRPAPGQAAGAPYTVYTTNMQSVQQQPVVYAPPPVAMNPQQQLGGQNDEAERKLFVRGLSWDTVDDSLRAEFIKYGDLVEASVVRDRKTGKSKGFGFVTFHHRASAASALQQPQKLIDGRSVTCNLASLGRVSMTMQPPSGGANVNPRPMQMAGAAPSYLGGYPAPPVQQDPYGMYAPPAMAPPVDPYRQQAYGYGAGGPSPYPQAHPHQYYAPPPGPSGPPQAMRRQ